jgi:putative spermidine/putrescine transport system substrate-binding protein
VKEDITKWSDLWKPSLKGKIAMPDFDPSHIITIAALMEAARGQLAEGRGQAEGAQGVHRGVLLHRRAEPGPDEDRAGAGAGDALGERLSPPGAGHPGEGGAARDYPGIVGIDTMAVMAGTKKAAAAHQFIDLALSKEIQSELVKALRAGPVNSGATVPATSRPAGIFASAGGVEGPRLHHERRGAGQEPPGWREWFTANIVKK